MKPPFQSHRLTYRALTPSDEPFISTLCSDSIAFANSNTALLKPPTAKWSQGFLSYLMNDTLLSVLICHPALRPEEQSDIIPKESGFDRNDLAPIGQVFLTKATSEEAHHRKASIGVDIIADYQGQGYGSEAVQWVLNWGFQTAGLHRIELSCFECNTGAKGLYERLGFTLEGRKRESLWSEGRWWDQYEYGMLEGQWRKRYLEA